MLIDKRGLQSLSDAFYKANETSDVESMLALYEVGEMKKQTIGYIRTAIEFEIGMPIEDIFFEPLSGSPEESIHYDHEGVLYQSSVKPKYRMIVRYLNEHTSTTKFTIGKNKNNQWRIMTASPTR